MKYYLIIFLLSLFFIACKSNSDNKDLSQYKTLAYAGNKTGNEVIIHELSDPDKLNPITSQGAGSTYMEHCMFMYLLDVDKEKLDVTPWLAKERPTITILESGPYKLKIDYEIRKEAVWDNGEPVTAHDVDFTFKTTKNPHVDAEHQRPYIEFISHIEIDANNPKKFSFYTSELNYAAEFNSGGVIYIIPEYIYDPQHLMRKFSLKELSDKNSLAKINGDNNLIQFAEQFNSEKFQREAGYVVGCGPYALKNWTTGQRIELVKKENWWGESLKEINGFANYPPKIIYEIVNDQVTAVTALKDEEIDIMQGIPARPFSELITNENFNSKYFLFSELQLSYIYIGINTRNPLLEDQKVRQALAHCVNTQQIIDILYYGYAQAMSSFVHPSKPYYNKQLKPYEFDLSKAKQLLADAGWTDSDKDGILDKEINGKKTPLKLTIKYNSGNDIREQICLFVKENATKIGIDMEILVREWSVYLDECKNHDFDMYVLGWVQEAISDDPKQLFHTDSYNGGSNYVGFGNGYSDKLIENIAQEMDDNKRAEMMKELQKIIHDEVPYIFLCSPDNLLAINKRFGNAKAYIARPGYEERELIVEPYK